MNVIILGQRHHFFCHFKSVRPVPPVPVSAPTKQEQAKSGFAGDPPSYKSRFSVYFPLFFPFFLYLYVNAITNFMKQSKKLKTN